MYTAQSQDTLSDERQREMEWQWMLRRSMYWWWALARRV